MKRRVLFTAIALLAALPLLVSAQTKTSSASTTSDERDALEVSVNAGLGLPMGAVKTWNDTLGAKSAIDLGGEVGMFLGQNYVLGLQFNYYQFGIDTQSDAKSLHHRLYSPALYLKRYFFGGSDFVPFVRIGAGLDFPKFATLINDAGSLKYRELSYNASFAFELGAGVFYYTSDFGGFYAEAGYHQGFTNGAKKSYQNQDYRFPGNISRFDLRAGIRVFFGSK
ncbi:MAG TPA: hypothetical protein VMS71_00445 [Candidatus Acidoferrum sp.]|nr:hypothetical protein [Candidatus Acidoferrum sp.]